MSIDSFSHSVGEGAVFYIFHLSIDCVRLLHGHVQIVSLFKSEGHKSPEL